jgi:hypothetical protein
MARVEDWLPDWVEEHRARHPGSFLPPFASEEGTELYEAWRAVFVKNGLQDYAVATEASKHLVGEKIAQPRDHLPTLITLAVGIYKQRQAQGLPTEGGGGADARKAAEDASRGCAPCGGTGLGTVYRPDPCPAQYRHASAVCYCDDCPYGRWIEKNHREKAPDVRKRMAWRSQLLRSGWLADPPWYDPVEAEARRNFTAAELARDLTSRARAERPERPAPPAPSPVPAPAPDDYADPLAAARIKALQAQIELLKAARPTPPTVDESSDVES